MGLFKPDVGKMERNKDVTGLIKALKHKDKFVRGDAAKALGRIKDARAVEPLIQCLNDKESWVREHAADALKEMGDARAVEPLIYALNDEDAIVRWKAAEALGKIGDARAEEPLVQASKDENSTVRMAVSIALRDLRLAVIKRARNVKDIEQLTQALRHEDVEVRRQAALALGEIGDSRAEEHLIQALQEEHGYVREKAAEALGKIGDARAVEPLIQTLKDKDSKVRSRAAHALGMIRDARAVGPLTQALIDEDIDVQDKAAWALTKIRGKGAVEEALAHITKSYNWERVRSGVKPGVFIETEAGSLEAVEVISGLHDDKLEHVDNSKSKAMEALVKNLFTEGRNMADWIHVYLAALSDPAFPRPGKAYALLAVSTVKSPVVTSALKALLPNQELGYVREYLPGALYRQGDRSSLSLLTKDPDKEVASKAKFFKKVVSCKKIGGNCPHMDDHGACLHGLMADNCPMIMWGYKVPDSGTAYMTTDNHLPCPRYQSTSPFH